MKKILQDKRRVVLLLLVFLVAAKVPTASYQFLLWVLGGIFVAGLSDFLYRMIVQKKKTMPLGAMISGAIVAGILDYREPWYWLVCFALVAVFYPNL